MLQPGYLCPPNLYAETRAFEGTALAAFRMRSGRGGETPPHGISALTKEAQGPRPSCPEDAAEAGEAAFT